MVKTMAKLRMAHGSTHGARKPPGPKYYFLSLHIQHNSGKIQTVKRNSILDNLSFD